jgi:hypothetical protein
MKPERAYIAVKQHTSQCKLPVIVRRSYAAAKLR